MVVVGIRTRSGDFTTIGQESNSIAEVEAQMAAILKKTTPYVTFKDLDGATYEVKRNEIESILVGEAEEVADDKKAD